MRCRPPAAHGRRPSPAGIRPVMTGAVLRRRKQTSNASPATASWRCRSLTPCNCSTPVRSSTSHSCRPPIDFAALKVGSDGGTLPPMSADLINAPDQGARSMTCWPRRNRPALLKRLEGSVRRRATRRPADLVMRSHIATVLGSASPEAIDPDRAFQELGFDSLTAVEMRTGSNPPPAWRFHHAHLRLPQLRGAGRLYVENCSAHHRKTLRRGGRGSRITTHCGVHSGQALTAGGSVGSVARAGK